MRIETDPLDERQRILGHLQNVGNERGGNLKNHINYDDPKAQAGALRNIQNHINAVGAENLDLKVVMHGKGLSLLLTPDALENTKLKYGNATDEIQAKISGLKDQGVGFHEGRAGPAAGIHGPGMVA